MQLVIDYPPSLPDALQHSREQFEREAKMAMATKLFEMKRPRSLFVSRAIKSSTNGGNKKCLTR